MEDEAQGLLVFFIALITRLPAEDVFAALELYWRSGVPGEQQLREALPDHAFDKHQQLHELIRAVDDFYRCLRPSFPEELIIDLPNGPATVWCEACDHETVVQPEDFAGLERSLSIDGCPHCGHLHIRGWWMLE